MGLVWTDWIQPADLFITPQVSFTEQAVVRGATTDEDDDPDWVTHTANPYRRTHYATTLRNPGDAPLLSGGFWSMSGAEIQGRIAGTRTNPPPQPAITRTALAMGTVRAADGHNPLSYDEVPPDAVEVEFESDTGTWHGPATIDVRLTVRARTLGTLNESGQALSTPDDRPVAGRTSLLPAHLPEQLVTETIAGQSLPSPGDLTAGQQLLEVTDPSSLDTWNATLADPFNNTYADPGVVVETTLVVADCTLSTGSIVQPFLSRVNHPTVQTTWPVPQEYGGSMLFGAATTYRMRRWYTPPRFRALVNRGGMWRLRQRQSAGAADGWSLRHRQNSNMSGSWPLRQRQDET